MLTRTYTPQAGGLADRVCSFFAANPSEEMTAYDIAVKFGGNKHNISTLLNQAIGAGLLVLARNDDLEWVYGPGPTISRYQPQVVSEEPPEHAPPATPPKPARAAAPAKQAQPTVLVLDDIPIEDDVPLPAVNHRPDAQARLAVMTRLLAKLQPGQSAPLPLDAYATLMKAMSAAHADTPAKFSTRRDKDAGTLRVWRVA